MINNLVNNESIKEVNKQVQIYSFKNNETKWRKNTQL